MVTDFGRKYRDDFFIRTEVNIIALVIVFAAVLLAVSVSALVFLYHGIVGSIANVIASLLTAPTTPISPEAVMAQLEAVRTRQIASVIAIVFAVAALFGYLVARFALKPARDARDAQKRFIGNIAHEIRTPLSIIKANTEVRLLDSDVTSEAKEIHESNLEELDRISNIINNLLTLNALVQPERVPFTNVDLNVLINKTVGKLKHLTDRKTVRLRVLADERYYARGNATALEQIFMNVIKNAVQHTETGDITIKLDEDLHGMAEVSVRDTGEGIKHEDLQHIFSPFYRGDQSRTRTQEKGAGLGLAIVNELVRLHRGRIGIQSTPGKGTQVVIALPSGTGAAAPDEPAANKVIVDFSKKRR